MGNRKERDREQRKSNSYTAAERGKEIDGQRDREVVKEENK